MMSTRSGYFKIEQENVLGKGLPDSQNKTKQIVWKYDRFIVITYFTSKQDNYMKKES